MPNIRRFPSTDNKRLWQPYRDAFYKEKVQELVKFLEIDLFIYQKSALIPPPPYKMYKVELIVFAGAKRIGKSMLNAIRVLPGVFLPGHITRLYAPEHRLASREFNWIKKLIFGPRDGACLVDAAPQLKQHLIEFEDNPKHEQIMRWSNGSEIRSQSATPDMKNWVGEEIDLGIICEPGQFVDLKHAYDHYIHPNLNDRGGLVCAAGTVDKLGMKDLHEQAHDHENHPNNFCFCEVPRVANLTLFERLRTESMSHSQWMNVISAQALRARREQSWQNFSVNWLGLWSEHVSTAIEQWDTKVHVQKVSLAAYEKLLEIPEGWFEFLGMDTGSHVACGHYIASPEGMILRIGEWVNYERRGQVEEITDSRGFGVFMKRIRRDVGGRRLLVIGDRTSQFKDDVNEAGFSWDDAKNDHGLTVSNCNQYLSQRKFKIIRPHGSGQTMLEREVLRARWSENSIGPAAKPQLDRHTRGHTFDEWRYALSSKLIAYARPEIDREKNWIQRDIESVIARCDNVQPDSFIDELPGLGGGF